MRFTKILIVSLSISVWAASPAFSHGNHNHLAGTVGGVFGIGLNLLELGKHGYVVYDQIINEEERNTQVLVGNALVGMAHLVNAKAFLDEMSAGVQSSSIKLPLMVLASSFNFWDLYVDGITAWEYWSKETSWQNVAVMLTAPACFVLNLHMVVSHAIKQKMS